MMMRKQFIVHTKRVYVLYSGIIVNFFNQSVVSPLASSLPPSLLPSSLTHPFSPSQLTQAALMGGTTMVMALVLPEQHCSLLDAYENCRALADAKACCDYALHVGVTWWGPKVRHAQGSRVQDVPGQMNGLKTRPLILF